MGLVGPVGCGKTSPLVTAYKLVAPRLLEYPAVPASTIRFVSVLDMLDLWRISFDEDKRTGEPRYSQLYKRFAEARLLILDDLGAERPTEWTQEQLNKLIDSRARNELPTWFTTNCSLEALEQLITPRCYSRLVYRADVLEVTSEDCGGCAGRQHASDPLTVDSSNGTSSNKADRLFFSASPLSAVL